MYIKRLSESRGHTTTEQIAMKVTAAVFFAVVIILTTPLCCEGFDFLGVPGVRFIARLLPPYSYVFQQQPLSGGSLETWEDWQYLWWSERLLDDFKQQPLSERFLEVEWHDLWVVVLFDDFEQMSFYRFKKQLFSERSVEVKLHYLWLKRLPYVFKQQPLSERSLEVKFALMYYIMEALNNDSAMLQQNAVKGLSPYSDVSQQQQHLSERSLEVKFALMYYIMEALTDDSAMLQLNAVKGLSPYSVASQQQQPTSEKSLKVSAYSRKWRKGVFGESRHAQSNVHDRIKKAFVEEAKVQNRAKRGLGLLTSCLTNAVGASLLVTALVTGKGGGSLDTSF